MTAHAAERGLSLGANPDGALTPDDLVRYGRHLSLPGVGPAGQARLKSAKVAIVGLGGLGSPAALYLAAAGVGTLGLIDGDRIDLSNLQRQVLYGDADVGHRKVDVAAHRLKQMNPQLVVKSHAFALDSGNALSVLSDFDIVLDGTDNFPARYLINDATVMLGIPSVHGSVLRFEGRVALFGTIDGPCYRCLYPEPPPPGVVQDCNDAGVLGVLPGLIGVLQATEVIKVICGFGETLAGRLLLIESLGLRFQTIRVPRNPGCPMCGTREITHLIDYDAFCNPGVRSDVATVTATQLARMLESGAQLVDVREQWEWEIGRLPGARLIPLADLEGQLSSLDRNREVVVYCHHGTRSMFAARQLLAAGFARVSNLEGGIDRWSVDVDHRVSRY
jgi:molybdopterin/thiamine biosynthesis adenylyltransferase/rhodanese-related sulfurtransferase